MKKGDLVWCWDGDESCKWLRIYVRKDIAGHVVTAYQDEHLTPHVNHCEPYTPEPEFQPGEEVLVWDESGWEKKLFVGVLKNGQIIAESIYHHGRITRWKKIRKLPETKTQVIPIVKAVQLLVGNGWEMNGAGQWGKKGALVVLPDMLLDYIEGAVYPDFLLEEVENVDTI